MPVPGSRQTPDSFHGVTLYLHRTVLGLWHPKYIEPACRLLPHLRRAHIGMSPAIARRYFWDACDTFSMNFACLVSDEGVKFRKELQAAGKVSRFPRASGRLSRRSREQSSSDPPLHQDLTVWTVNARNEMIEATKWGAKAILTDRTKALLDLRAEMQQDWDKVSKETTGLFRWTSFWYTGPANVSVHSSSCLLPVPGCRNKLTPVSPAFGAVPRLVVGVLYPHQDRRRIPPAPSRGQDPPGAHRSTHNRRQSQLITTTQPRQGSLFPLPFSLTIPISLPSSLSTVPL